MKLTLDDPRFRTTGNLPQWKRLGNFRWFKENVVQAARARMRYCFENYDDVIISFSGGKDSLACLLIGEMVKNEMGITTPLKVYFLDEELIPDSVIDFIAKLREDTERFEFIWVAVPTLSVSYSLGKISSYIQWDEGGRPWVRKKPEWALTDLGEGWMDEPYSQKKSYIWLGEKFYPKKVINVCGIRSAESYERRRAMMAMKTCPFISAPFENKIVSDTAFPIYDWSEDDIFRFFYDAGEEYCSIYDAEVFSRNSLRVATPLTTEGMQNIRKLKLQDPDFYNRLIASFPECRNHEIYSKEFDVLHSMRDLPHTEEAFEKYVEEHNDPDDQWNQIVQKEAGNALRCRRRNIAKGEALPFGKIPLLKLWESYLSGGLRRGMMITTVDPSNYDKLSERYWEYEGFKKE